MKPKTLLILAIFLIFLVLSVGCVEISSTTRSAGNVLVDIEIVEHTYLWGDDGPLTRVYDIRVRSLGVEVLNVKSITKQEIESIVAKYG